MVTRSGSIASDHHPVFTFARLSETFTAGEKIDQHGVFSVEKPIKMSGCDKDSGFLKISVG